MGAPKTYMFLEFGRFRFSGEEIRDLLIAAGLLAFIFGYNGLMGAATTQEMIGAFGLYFFLIGPAFLLHEIGHKLVAQSYHCWSEFRMSKSWLLLALVLRLVNFPFLILAPGATYYVPFRHGLSHFALRKKEIGKISIAGPIVNFVLALLFLALKPLLGELALAAIHINLLLALFNLLPIQPLDGAKVLQWDRNLWIASFLIILGLFVFL